MPFVLTMTDPQQQELVQLRRQVKMLSQILEQYKRGVNAIREAVLTNIETVKEISGGISKRLLGGSK